jgi:hypothetical protein
VVLSRSLAARRRSRRLTRHGGIARRR